MGNIQFSPCQLHGWEGYRISGGDLVCVVTPALGGRIMSLAYRGEELLFTDRDHWGEVFDFTGREDLSDLKRRMGFRVWGGDKTWIAPQNGWKEGIPPLELDAGRYAVRLMADGLEMISAVCHETGLQIVRRVSMDQDGNVILDQELWNKTQRVVEKGIWNVTQVLRPWDIYLHCPASAIRSYHLDDPTLPVPGIALSEEQGWTGIPCRDAALFKFGGIVDSGVVVALRNRPQDIIGFARYFDCDPRAPYAHRSTVEVFNSPDKNYCEIEVHAPLVPIAPGQSVRHRQVWRIRSFPARAGLSKALASFLAT